MLPLEKKQFRGKLLPYSDLQLGVFLEEKLHFRSYSKEEDKQKQHHDWNIRPSMKERSPQNCKRRWRRRNAKHWH
jgi:hypothetical protein